MTGSVLFLLSKKVLIAHFHVGKQRDSQEKQIDPETISDCSNCFLFLISLNLYFEWSLGKSPL